METLNMPTANFASYSMGTRISCSMISCQDRTSHRSFHVLLTLLAGGKAASICRFSFCLQAPQREVLNYQTLVCALVTNLSVFCPIWDPGPKPCPHGVWRCEDVGTCSREFPHKSWHPSLSTFSFVIQQQHFPVESPPPPKPPQWRLF